MSTARSLDNDRCLLLRLTHDSEVLLFAFSSNNPRSRMFEFSGAMAGLEAKQVLLRDPSGLWYHCGLPGLGPEVETVAETLDHLRIGCKARRAITLGISAGGYAAILFGVLLGVDEVLAFAPQTRLRLGDSRVRGRIEALHAAVGPDNPYFDLRELLTSVPSPATRIHVFFSPEDELDSRHARHLQGLPNVETYPVDCKGHRIARQLKSDGRLERILACAISGSAGREQLASVLAGASPG